MRYKSIVVRAGHGTPDDLLENGWSIVDTDVETVNGAKASAKRYLTREYARLAEMSDPFDYAQVLGDGEVIYDYFRTPDAEDKRPA